MLYNSLKILHIISAACVLTSIAYSYYLWRSIRPANRITLLNRMQTQTLLIIVPFAIFQLATGFTMISLKHYAANQLWIGGSIISFMVVIGSWLGFMYFLFLSQQVTVSLQTDDPIKKYHHLQSFFLLMCAIGLLCMIFFMANKSTL